MSLLMDALRKAEEAKRAAAQAAPAAEPGTLTIAEDNHGLALEPISTVAETNASAGVQEPTITPPSPSAQKNTEQVQRKAIQNAFTAKTAKPANRSFLWAFAILAGLALIGGGAYVWWQMQPRQPSMPPMAAMPPAPPPVAAPLPPAQQTPAPTAVIEAPAVATAPATAPQPEPTAWRGRTTPPAETAPVSPIRITQSKPRVNPLLDQGYEALQQGRLAQAQQAYEQMLAIDPRSIDALYGLAAIAASRQQMGLAEDYYLRILENDPRDPLAHAGLAGIKGQSSGGNAESRLKTLIAEQPNVAQLHFALGNIYAQGQRWRDAQQAYFLAYKNDNANPDVVFNLAVSLDQLHQDKLAAQYYGEALRLAANRPGAFNREQVQARLRDLQGTPGNTAP